MFVDARTALMGKTIDIVIIGSGAAGLCLSETLAGRGVSSVILEAGSRDFTEQSQSFYQGRTVGDPYHTLDSSRLRIYGGTIRHWGGWSLPMDPEDFHAKPFAQVPAWPITFRDLAPYEQRVAHYLGVKPRPKRGFDRNLDQYFMNYASRPFLEAFETAVAQAGHCKVALETAVQLITPRRDGHYDIEAKTLAGDRAHFTARRLVVACGGIENSRLLLWCNRATGGRLIPAASTLGHYFMEHPSFTAGEAIINGPLDAACDRREVSFFSPRPGVRDAFKILNAGVRVHERHADHVEASCPSNPPTAPLSAWVEASRPCLRQVRISWEQQPVRDNRVNLDETVDAHGIPRPVLHWRRSDLDRQTARVALEVFGRALVESRSGRLRIEPHFLDEADYPTNDEIAGRHHMGGTRMALRGEDGVVDRNLQVFDRPGLFVLGSSVFPSSGHANPTFTVLQLAMRLADHLRR
jgi:choline dehydrogenase-like flavoprotein